MSHLPGLQYLRVRYVCTLHQLPLGTVTEARRTGFSLGANILTKYVGEEGERCPLQGLVTLANPWNFTRGAEHLPFTFLGKHVYRYVLGGALRTLLHLHRRVFLDAPELPVSRAQLEDVFGRRRLTLRQYDELVAAPMYGFKDAWDYYAQISSCRVIRDIRTPCLAINSLDDPITGSKSLPIDEVSMQQSSCRRRHLRCLHVEFADVTVC